LYDSIFAVFRTAGITPVIGQEAIQMQTIVSLVSAGMGIALVPQSVSNLRRPGVEYRPLAHNSPMVETGLAWRRDNASPVLRGFLDLMRKRV
jgi:DNA-binding transcriptional LysR family regulator